MGGERVEQQEQRERITGIKMHCTKNSLFLIKEKIKGKYKN